MPSGEPQERAGERAGERGVAKERAVVERGRYDRSLSAAARKKDARRALVAAATAVFAERGYANASVEDVVREAGVSRRTF
ncbi:MAG: helix-turn-helix transcriptional regulator [Deltaproteobacteria bacterium]|nr:helix-turn-helix transcriptional regulator [Deltaproteobacteria bacterium]